MDESLGQSEQHSINNNKRNMMCSSTPPNWHPHVYENPKKPTPFFIADILGISRSSVCKDNSKSLGESVQINKHDNSPSVVVCVANDGVMNGDVECNSLPYSDNNGGNVDVKDVNRPELEEQVLNGQSRHGHQPLLTSHVKETPQNQGMHPLIGSHKQGTHPLSAPQIGGVVPAHTQGPHPLHVPQSQLCRSQDFPNERNLPEEGCSDRSSPLDLSNSMSRSSSYSSIHQDGESVILSLLTSSRRCFWSPSGQIYFKSIPDVLRKCSYR